MPGISHDETPLSEAERLAIAGGNFILACRGIEPTPEVANDKLVKCPWTPLSEDELRAYQQGAIAQKALDDSKLLELQETIYRLQIDNASLISLHKTKLNGPSLEDVLTVMGLNNKSTLPYFGTILIERLTALYAEYPERGIEPVPEADCE